MASVKCFSHAWGPAFSLWHLCEGWCGGIHLHASSGESGTGEPLGLPPCYSLAQSRELSGRTCLSSDEDDDEASVNL